MKIVKANNGTTKLTISKKEWEEIGKTAGWIEDSIDDPFHEDLVTVVSLTKKDLYDELAKHFAPTRIFNENAEIAIYHFSKRHMRNHESDDLYNIYSSFKNKNLPQPSGLALSMVKILEDKFI